ncbi:unnamed protein product [Caenorhabditis nigoni]
MTSIIEMPELVMEKIVGVSDFKSVLTLRQVCRDFRNFIDRLNDSKLPDSKFKLIRISADIDVPDDNENKIMFDFVDSEGSFYRFKYSESENSRKFKDKTTILENSNIVDVAIQDLELILKFQKSILECLSFCFDDLQLQNDSSLYEFPVKLSNMFEKINRKFKTKELSIEAYSQSQIMSFLPLVDPDSLRKLNFNSEDDELEFEINEIVKTEQWKKAERLNCDINVLNLKVEEICHFLSCSLITDSITAKDLDFLRKTFLGSSKFEKLSLELNDFNEQEDLSNIWGEAFETVYSIIWYFRMKDCQETILMIAIQQEYISFDTIQIRYVPDGVIVHGYNEN